MKKFVTVVTIVSLTIIIVGGAMSLPIFANAPENAVDLGWDGLFKTDTKTWDRPENLAIQGNTNTYYQWFYTRLPLHQRLYYTVPYLMYTYDGTYNENQPSVTWYGLQIKTTDYNALGWQNIKIRFLKMTPNGTYTNLGEHNYYYNTDYYASFVFCGWGMDETGAPCYLIEVDGSLQYIKIANTINGDKHLYAVPQRFNGLYIMGFNTMAMDANEVNAKMDYQRLQSETNNSTVLDLWLQHITLPPIEHKFNIMLPEAKYYASNNTGTSTNNWEVKYTLGDIYEGFPMYDYDTEYQITIERDDVLGIGYAFKSVIKITIFVVDAPAETKMYFEYVFTDKNEAPDGIQFGNDTTIYKLTKDDPILQTDSKMTQHSELTQRIYVNKGEYFDCDLFLWCPARYYEWNNDEVNEEQEIMDQILGDYKPGSYKPQVNFENVEVKQIFDIVFGLPGVLTLSICATSFIIARAVLHRD